MDIRLLDDSEIADDDLMRELYDLSARAELVGREQMPFWRLEEFLGALRSHDSGERQEVLVAADAGRPVGLAVLWSFLLDNTDKSWFKVDVDPPVRRRGVGRALVEELERRARDDGRTLLLGDTRVPPGQRETHAHRRFAEACGFEYSNVEVVRHLQLPVDDDRIQGWLDHAGERASGYTLLTLVDEIPEDLAESLCVLLGQLGVDAPTGAVDFEEEAMTPERLVERQETARAMGRAIYETVALTPDRQVAAHSTLAVPLSGSTDVFQWGTFVHRDHRGHRLGLATKATNLRAVQRDHPGLRRVTTQNAETNDYMVSINVLMGFEAVEESVEFYKAL